MIDHNEERILRRSFLLFMLTFGLIFIVIQNVISAQVAAEAPNLNVVMALAFLLAYLLLFLFGTSVAGIFILLVFQGTMWYFASGGDWPLLAGSGLIPLPLIAAIVSGPKAALFSGITLVFQYYYIVDEGSTGQIHGARVLWNSCGAIIFIAITSAYFDYSRQKQMNQMAHLIALRDNFTSDLSHEIRTPTNGIIGTAVMLQSENDIDKVHELANILHQSSKQLLAVVNQILDMTAAQKTDKEVSEVFSPYERANACFQMFLAKAKASNITYSFDADDNVSNIRCRGDPNALSQIWTNLLANALNYGTSVVIFRISYSSGGWLQSEVQDDGDGLSVEDKEQIFQPFVRLERTRGKSGGTGLGLSISQKLVSRLGGTLELESEPGMGAIFRVSVPLKLCVTPTPPAHSTEQLRCPPFENSPLVAFVDDNLINRVVFKKQLERLKCVPAIFESGAELFEFLADDSPQVTMIFLDLYLENETGIQICRQLRQWGVTTPIACCSASVMEKDKRMCKDAGISTFLEKPVILSKLRELIQSSLAKSHDAKDFG